MVHHMMSALAGTSKAERLLILLDIQVKRASELGLMGDAQGGNFFFTDLQPTGVELKAGIGQVNPESRSRNFCEEKVRRLLAHPGHTRSWQSRDPDADQYGGAILTESWAGGFSGAPEATDEPLMLSVAVLNGDLEHDQALEWAQEDTIPGEKDVIGAYRLLMDDVG